MCHKIRCDGKSWKLFGFHGELKKALFGEKNGGHYGDNGEAQSIGNSTYSTLQWNNRALFVVECLLFPPKFSSGGQDQERMISTMVGGWS